MIKCVKCKYSHDVVLKNGRFVFICESGLESYSDECERFVPFNSEA